MFTENKTPLLAFHLWFGLACVLPAPALAQDNTYDPAGAEALYHRGRELVAAGNWAEGCEKFQASMKLNPAVSTLINIARCHEQQGRLALALSEYRRALQLNQDTLGAERKRALEELADEGIKALEPRLARVELRVTTRPEGLRIARDGQELPLGMMGEAIPLDPGEHVFVASAPGYLTDERRVKLGEGEKATVELEPRPAPTVIEKPEDPGVKEKPGGAVLKNDAPKPPAQPEARVPAWAFASGALGVVLVGAGVAFRLDQTEAEKTLLAQCGQELLCDPNKPYDPKDDNARKNRSFGLFVGLTAAGAVGIGVAAVGIATGLSGSKQPQAVSMPLAPWFDRSGGGVVWRGAF